MINELGHVRRSVLRLRSRRPTEGGQAGGGRAAGTLTREYVVDPGRRAHSPGSSRIEHDGLQIGGTVEKVSKIEVRLV